MLKNLKRNPKKNIILLILFLFTTGSTLYLLYALSLLRGIENTIRIVFSIILILLWIGFTLSYLKSSTKRKSKYLFYIPFVLLYSGILLVLGYYVIKTYKVVDNMSTNKDVYTSSLVVLRENKAKKIEDFKDGDIGILADSTSIEGNQIPTEVITKKKLSNEIKEYDTYMELIQALYDEEIEGAFLPTGYVSSFQNAEGYDFKTLADDTKIIFTQEKTIKQQSENKNASLKEPFTILLMGIDSELETISSGAANGDSLMVITFNPITLNATMLSIPRDTYVPIACVNGTPKSKITHAAGYGQQCMIDTIQNYTGVHIDYYVKINFKGLVKLVDTLGGIDIDVPFAFCEQNSNREWGDKTIYVEEGFQTLNGEQALAFSRHRKDDYSRYFCPAKYIGQGVVNDFVRGQNQQEVVKAMLNKMKTVRSIDTIYKLLDTVSNSMQTNMTTTQILSLYNIGKDIIAKSSGENVEDLLGIQKLYLSGVDGNLYDALGGQNLYEYLVYEDSLAEVVEAMKINLGLQEPEIEKEFTFAIDEEYEEYIPGKSGNYTKVTTTSDVLPDFTGDTEAQARSYALKHGISIRIQYTQSGSGTNGTVIAQSVKKGVSIKKAGTVTLTILQKTQINNTEKNTDTSNTTQSGSNHQDTTSQDKDSDTDTSNQDTQKEEPKTDKDEETTDSENDSDITIDDITGLN